MAKKGFRGERKRSPHPVPLPRRGGMYGRKIKRNTPLLTYSPLADFRSKGKLVTDRNTSYKLALAGR